jgi:hypothetical protein
MNKQSRITASTPLAGNLAGAVSPRAAPATFTRCPDCDGVFSDRIVDEDTGCSYPVDDGEYYCEGCDALWTADALTVASFEEPLVEVERISPTRIAA